MHTHPTADQYYIPHGSPWPIVGSVALFTIMLGAHRLPERRGWPGGWAFVPGAVLLAFMFIGWFCDGLIGENASAASTTCRSTARSAWG